MDKITLVFTAILLISACKNEPQNQTTANADNANTTISKSVDATVPITSDPGDSIKPGVRDYKNSSLLPITDPCVLINQKFLEDALGTKLNSFTIKSGNVGNQSQSKSCFFRWVTSSSPNAGVLLQIMNNAVSDEAPDWPSLFIQSKLNDGEQVPHTGQVAKYKSFTDLGDGGAYSEEAGKYHWRLGNDYVFMLAFNTDHKGSQQKKLAMKIGAEIMKNYQAVNKR